MPKPTLAVVRRQRRLTVPVSDAEQSQARQLRVHRVDGAKSTAELVRNLLKERFAKFLQERKSLRATNVARISRMSGKSVVNALVAKATNRSIRGKVAHATP